MLQVTAIHKNSVVIALSLAVILTIVEHIDTLTLHLAETSVLLIGAQVLQAMWRGVGAFQKKEEETPSQGASEVPQALTSVVEEQVSEPVSDEPTPEAYLQETVNTDTSEQVVEEAALETAQVVAPQQPVLVENSSEGTPEMDDLKPLLKGFSPRPMWKRLCQHLRDKEHLSVDGYSKISNAEKRAAFLIRNGVTVGMMQQARLYILNVQ